MLNANFLNFVSPFVSSLPPPLYLELRELKLEERREERIKKAQREMTRALSL